MNANYLLAAIDAKYIVAIVTVGVFAILFLVFFILLTYKREKEAKLQLYIHETYAENNLIKFDYDSVDENTPPVIEGHVSAITSLAMAKHEDVQEEQLHMEEVFGKNTNDGIEEITGNYQQQ